MKIRKDQVRTADDYFSPVKVRFDASIMRSQSDSYRHAQGLARLFGRPNTRDHTACDHDNEVIMPRIAEVKVGSRNREKTASVVELLFDWSELLDTDGDFYTPMIQKGITLEEGEDYRILDSDGNVIALKSGPEKVRSLIVCELADRLNVSTSVKVPLGGASVAIGARNWVAFRPRMDAPFETSEARNEYIEKNGGNHAAAIVEEENGHNEETN